jgi:poly-gamma-glutamate synthesis protein (capsule biosynthesis protein)
MTTMPGRCRIVVVLVAAAVLAVATSCTDPTSARSAPRDPTVVASTDRTAPTATSTPGAPTTVGPPPTTEPPPTEVSLAFGGDVLTHLPLVATARGHGAAVGAPYDFGPLLAPLTPVVSAADLALCHLEVPLVAEGQAVSGYPSFRAPRELAPALASTGYDGCSTASNHSLDGGMPGIASTLDAFDATGLGHSGTARSAEEAATPRIYEVDGARIAHLSYAYGFNGYQLPADAPWAANLIDVDRIAADARAARGAGAHLVVVSLHWGTEYRSEPDATQDDVAARLAGIPEVDLVIGHHAHVVQPIQRVGDTWVVFGLGNQLSNQADPPRRDGLTVVVTVRGPRGGALEVVAIEAVPTWVDLPDHRVVPVAEALADPGLDPARRAELEDSLARTMEAVNRRGAGIPVAAWS